jgi:hypothetical protein
LRQRRRQSERDYIEEVEAKAAISREGAELLRADMPPLDARIAKAIRNAEENESHFVGLLEPMKLDDRSVFHARVLEAFFGVIDPDEFKIVCALIVHAMAYRGEKGDAETVH